MNKNLSPKLKKFLDFINRFTLVHGQPPSYEEIMGNLGFGSLGTVNWYVKTLEDQGHLHRVKGPNGKRALTVAQKELPATTTACLPLLGLIAAGEPIEALENPEMVDVPPSLLHPSNYVLQVKGDSMIDENIHDGDYIVARKAKTARPGQIVEAQVQNLEILVVQKVLHDLFGMVFHVHSYETELSQVLEDSAVGHELRY